jgi:alanine-glyoxylate transaminase/(R)-3-amino-2-methylpropionate-pyruvate transaminase
LEKLKFKYSIIGDVRGKGLMIGLELIKNDEFASPVENEKYIEVWEACRDLGLIIGRGGIHGNVI